MRASFTPNGVYRDLNAGTAWDIYYVVFGGKVCLPGTQELYAAYNHLDALVEEVQKPKHSEVPLAHFRLGQTERPAHRAMWHPGGDPWAHAAQDAMPDLSGLTRRGKGG